MDKSQKLLLSLVRNSLWGSPVEGLSSETDWKEIIRLGSQQTLLGFVADAMKNIPEEYHPDESLIKKLRFHLIRNYQAHAMLNTRLSDVLAILKAEGIPAVLFKGQGVASNYPEPLLRQCGDIDMYVGNENYEKASILLIDRYGSDEHNSETVKHFHIHTEDVIVEIHKIAETVLGSGRNRRFQKWTVECLQPQNLRMTDISGTLVPLPPVSFDIIYVMHHAWHHFLNGGIGLRQLCDWTMLLHRFHNEIDITELKKNLKSFGLLDVWKMFSEIAVRHLGLPENECPLYSDGYQSKSDMILDFVFDEGNFGHHAVRHKDPRPEGYSAGKLHSMKMSLKRYLAIFPVSPKLVTEAAAAFMMKGITAYFKGLR